MYSLGSTDYADLHRLKKPRLRQSAKICGPIIWEQPLRNPAQAFAPKLKMRCRSLAQTRMRSRNRHRGSLRVRFSNPQRLMLYQGSLPIPQAKLPSKDRPTRGHSELSRQKFAVPAANRLNRGRAATHRRGTVRTELQ